MPTFRTEILPNKAPFSIGYDCSTLAIGSCFVENIGTYLAERQLPILLNPFGIVYNPLSMAQELDYLLSENAFPMDELVSFNGLWHSWLHHSRFSGADKELVRQNITERLVAARHFFQKTNRLILTFGTAHVFELKKTGAIVANCHKAPPQCFDKKRLSVDAIVDSFSPIFEKISDQNKDIQIVLTVSPIRHTREGLVANNRSKAILLLACEALTVQFPNVYYFPAYEIVMDDLRDYRFYERDMIHPSPQAIEYIWQIFSDTFFDLKTKELIKELEKINQMRAHRPLHGENTEGYQDFLKNLNRKISSLEEQFPFLRF